MEPGDVVCDKVSFMLANRCRSFAETAYLRHRQPKLNVALIGYLLLAFAAVAFAFGLYVSFTSEGGTLGQVPVLLHALMFPLLLTVALFCLYTARVAWAALPIRFVVLGFPVCLVLAGFLIIQAGHFGRYWHRRQKLRNSKPGTPPNSRDGTRPGNSAIGEGPPSES